MAEIQNNIYEIEPEGLSGFVGITEEDVKLISSAQISKTFKPNDNFIELSYFSLDNTRLTTTSNYTNYSVLSGDTLSNTQGNSEISIDVEQDYREYGFLGTDVKALYNFLDYPYSTSNTPQDFYIESISPDRTEIRLVSVDLTREDINRITDTLISQYSSTYIPDFYLYLGDNTYYSVVNINKEEFRDTTAVLVKLYSPLPVSVNTKVRLNIVERIGNSIAYEINSIVTPEQPIIPTLRGANFDVEVEVQATEPSQYYNYNELFSFPTNNTYRELNSLFNQKGAELGIDYSNFANFINFSSAQERLLNFRYKLDLIESYQGSLDAINNTTYLGTGITGSREYYENLIKGVINNFDHYERHLYFESGSTSWPKSNSSKPYINQLSSTNEAITWYNAEIQDAVLYDAQNPDILTNSIPAYLKEDTDNRPYELFIHMIAQHFDNLWLYTDAVSKKYDADNRLNRGVSKDLVEDLLRNFGIKLYTSNKSADDLFRYFTANSYNTTDEYIPGGITTSGQKAISQNDYQKEIYKRIYHNLPLLMKSKGTERGLRALINCFGIPSDILKIKVYGGQSVEDLPFFGGEQAWTGSLDKVRIHNTGSIIPGDTLSFYTGISKNSNNYTQDLHRIEVGFSPTDNIDNYIVSQSAVLFPDSSFNIDDYVGDPRETLTNRYTGLYSYSKTILNDLNSYNVKDFIRLIKFFDNVVFRMVRDFIPARAVADTGIIIKPHLLERNKTTSPVMTWTRPEYSGSIDTAFITGSNGGAYKSVGFGATGSLFNKESSTRKQRTVQTPLGKRGVRDRWHDQPKFNGELHQSNIRITNGELNKDNPFKNLEYPNVTYEVQFYLEPPVDTCTLTTTTLDRLIIDQVGTNSEFKHYNLGNMFPGSSGIYDYEVTTNGQTTTLTGQDLMYDFLQNGTYQQYQIFEAVAYHENNDILFGGTCTNEREAIIVKCDLAFILSNVPAVVIPNETYNLNTWWNSTTSVNTDITYTINGQSYSPVEVENIEFPETEYTNGQDITIVIQENNNPTGCKLETTVIYNNCTISPISEQYYVNTENQYTFPYNFAGVLENITTFSFRLEWCDIGFFGLDLCTPYGVTPSNTYRGYWIDIDPNNLVKSGQLSDILNQYPSANATDPDESPIPLNYQSFSTIKSIIDVGGANGPFRMRFRAQNSTGCVEEHPLVVFLGTTSPEPVYNTFTIAYNTSLEKACCKGPTTQTVLTTASSIDSLLYENIYPIPNPPAIYSSIDPLTFAPTGYYTDGSIARYWDGRVGFWSGILTINYSSTNTGYIVCDNNTHVDLDLCKFSN
jgi:hypothetical protein